MLVRKIRGQDKIGRIILTPTDLILAQKLGFSVEDYVNNRLIFIAKERRWKWFFNREIAYAKGTA